MNLRTFATVFAILAAFGLVCTPADAQSTQTTKKRVIARNADRTVVTMRDEDGRTRTKIIVQKRSFLDPGTQVFLGEQRYNAGPALVWAPTFTSPQNNTAFSRDVPLPGRFDLPFNDNPVYWSRD